jgi:ribosomal protein L29
MKNTDKQKLIDSTPNQLGDELKKLTIELNQQKMDLKIGKLTDHKGAYKTRKKIAIIQTLITQQRSEKLGDQ